MFSLLTIVPVTDFNQYGPAVREKNSFRVSNSVSSTSCSTVPVRRSSSECSNGLKFQGGRSTKSLSLAVVTGRNSTLPSKYFIFFFSTADRFSAAIFKIYIGRCIVARFGLTGINFSFGAVSEIREDSPALPMLGGSRANATTKGVVSVDQRTCILYA